MSSKTTNVLIVGATGYIGGSVFQRLLDLSSVKDGSMKLTVLVRTQSAADKFQTLGAGVNAVVGSFYDNDILSNLSSEMDAIILSLTMVTRESSLTAVLSGLKKRAEATGRVPALLYFSGATLVMDYAKGMYASETRYSDKNREQLDEVLSRPKQVHAKAHHLLEDADEQGYVRTYILVPSHVSGIPENKLTELGLQNTTSYDISTMAEAAIARGLVGIVGEGKNEFGFVDNGELVDLFMLIFNAAFNNADSGHGREGTYFASSGEIVWKELGEALGKGLFKAGKVTSPAVSTLTPEEEDKLFPDPMAAIYGSNIRVSSDRAHDLGWRPTKTLEDVKESITKEVVLYLEVKASKS